ncbi:MAG: hypothetical protein H0V05_12500 [Euzebyaceae bacterium]|nr:hypothetical protein [Euzebyaceae bacterium]
MGVTVLLIAVVGLLAGEGPLLGVFNIEIVEDLIHVVSGGLLAYAGFGTRDAGLTRTIVGGIGVVYLIVGVIGFILPMLMGLLPEYGYSLADNLLHLALGGLALGAVAAPTPARTR